MRNLNYVTSETRENVEKIMSDYAVSESVKDMIRDGLNRDCWDAAYDAALALNVLRKVMGDVLSQRVGQGVSE